MEKIQLISSSPRRQVLLNQMGIPFEVTSVDTEEFLDPKLSPEDLVSSIAEEKLQTYLDSTKTIAQWAIAADTLIYFKGKAIGKPVDRSNAYKELSSFSGKTHQVLTGISLYNKQDKSIVNKVNRTDVTFKDLREEELQWYLDTEEWMGVAGSYRIQGKGECLIESIKGSYSSVMGLPIALLYGMLRESNYQFDKFPAGNC